MGRAQPTCLGDENTNRNLARWSERLAKTLNGKISFGATMQNPSANGQNTDNNMEVWKASGTSPGGAGTPFTINHALGRVPICIVGQITNNGGVLYGDVTTWTKTQVTLKCTTASAAYRVILA